MKKAELMEKLKARAGFYPKTAWSRGVYDYSIDLVDALPDGDYTRANIRKALLNGADNWQQYSDGGCALIYDVDIAEALCTPSFLRKKKGGDLPPGRGESWLDVQTRALKQAEVRIRLCLPPMSVPVSPAPAEVRQ